MLTAMVREFAEFEHVLNEVDTSCEDLLRDGFRESPYFQALIAEWNGQTAPYALYFFTYSTLAGRPSLFVEDLFVRPEFRRNGVGKALLKHMAVIARQQNCYGMRWEVFKWNGSAIDSYRSLGAEGQKDLFLVLFMGDRFEKLAK